MISSGVNVALESCVISLSSLDQCFTVLMVRRILPTFLRESYLLQFMLVVLTLLVVVYDC